MFSTHENIHEAAFSGDFRLLKTIIETEEVSIDIRDEMGQTALHKASTSGWYELVLLLIEHGAQVNSKDLAGCTPLHHAASNGYLQICRFLVEKCQASPSCRSNKGYTPAHMAKTNSQMQTTNYLLQQTCYR